MRLCLELAIAYAFAVDAELDVLVKVELCEDNDVVALVVEVGVVLDETEDELELEVDEIQNAASKKLPKSPLKERPLTSLKL